MSRNKYDIDETLESDFNIKQFGKALVYSKRQAKPLITALLLNAAATIASLFTPYLLKIVTDDCIPQKNLHGMLWIAAAYAGILIITTVFGAIQGYLIGYAGQHIVSDMRHDLFTHLQKLPFTYYDSRPHGKILVRVTSYVSSVSDFLTTGLINFVIDIFSIIVITVFMLSIDWRAGLITLCGVPLIALTVALLKPPQHKAKRAYNNKSANYHAYLNESIIGMKITQSFSREDVNAEIFERLITENKDTWMKRVKLQFLVPFFLDMISITFTCLLYFFSASFLSAGTMLLGTLLAMTRYANRFWTPITSLGDLYSQLAEIGAYLERIFETMNEPVDIQSLPGSKDMPIEGKVEFKNVCFSYEEGRRVLNNVSFTVNKGESVAFVGPTGAGKSTVVNLISRFYEPDSGEILIDGKNITDYTIHSLRSQMGIMLQDTFLFSGTIEDNIRYGNLEATPEELKDAAKAVMADEFISRMADGYKSVIGERGQALSAGQKQLISFARTLAAKPSILILDEATSTIDTQTERALQAGIKALTEGRTSFIIAHRLSTIRDCDRIMYISDGRITEQGSHEELLAKKGDYYRLYTSQSEIHTSRSAEAAIT